MRRLGVLVALVTLTGGVVLGADAVEARIGGDDGGAGAPVGVAPLDDGDGDVAGLEPRLAHALARAQELARADGIELLVNSGYRSRAEQQRLYAEAIRKYGSPEAARRWVLPPDESAHVSGDAVDVGPPEAARWLEEHGERLGLCRVYDNEPWHFERLAGAVGSTCPPRKPHA